VKRGGVGRKEEKERARVGRPLIHVSGYAAVMTGSPFCGYNTT